MFKIKRLQKNLEHQEKGSDVITAAVFMIIFTFICLIWWAVSVTSEPMNKIAGSQVASTETCSILYTEPVISEKNGELVLNSDNNYIQKMHTNALKFRSHTYLRHCGFDSLDENRNNAYTFTYTTTSGDIETVTVPEKFVKFKQSSSEPPTVTVKKLEKLEGEGLYEISIPLEEYTKIMNNK